MKLNYIHTWKFLPSHDLIAITSICILQKGKNHERYSYNIRLSQMSQKEIINAQNLFVLYYFTELCTIRFSLLLHLLFPYKMKGTFGTTWCTHLQGQIDYLKVRLLVLFIHLDNNRCYNIDHSCLKSYKKRYINDTKYTSNLDKFVQN